MIPSAALRDATSDLPEEATFWMPSDDDIDEGGLGYFRDTWLIRPVSAEDAAEVVATELELVTVVDALADDERTYDLLAVAIEGNDPDSWPEGVRSTPAGEDLRASLGVEPMNECLDLGVAGLVYALAAVGCWPAASCSGRHGWSPVPVVYFASDRGRAEWLRPLVARSSCVFGVDDHRPNLLMIMGSSVRNFSSLRPPEVGFRRLFSLIMV